MTGPIALAVHSCDRYKLLYEGFLYFFKKYWPKDANIANYYFITEEEDIKDELFKNIKTGSGEWADRLKRALGMIDEEYVLYIQEDMWLNGHVQQAAINGIISYAMHNNVGLFKLNSSDVYKTSPSGTFVGGLSIATLNNNDSDYLMSHQPAIWNKKFLAAQLLPGEHPWRNERKATKRLRKLGPVIYHADLFLENLHAAINNNKANAQLSAYNTVSVNACLNESVLPFIEQLRADGQHAEYAEKLFYNYTQQITHDGQAKPRNVSLLKRLFKY